MLQFNLIWLVLCPLPSSISYDDSLRLFLEIHIILFHRMILLSRLRIVFIFNPNIITWSSLLKFSSLYLALHSISSTVSEVYPLLLDSLYRMISLTTDLTRIHDLILTGILDLTLTGILDLIRVFELIRENAGVNCVGGIDRFDRVDSRFDRGCLSLKCLWEIFFKTHFWYFELRNFERLKLSLIYSSLIEKRINPCLDIFDSLRLLDDLIFQFSLLYPTLSLSIHLSILLLNFLPILNVLVFHFGFLPV